ncbi:MAG TPA: sigma-70 family RNA polymerase sigma factor [Chloroflexota bacterium]
MFQWTMMDDQSLSHNLASDLDQHFEQLVRTYQDRLYGFTLRLTRSREEAEECAQDTFVRAYRALAGYAAERRVELRLRPWLYRIALNVVRNRLRRPRLASVSVDGPVGDYLASGAEDQPEAMVLQAEGWSRLEVALANLPPRYRTAVVLRHVQGLPYAEVSEVLDQPIGTTKSDVHRGLRLLREALESELLLEARNIG